MAAIRTLYSTFLSPLLIHPYGSGSTNYSQALADFHKRRLDDLDRRTTFIILGDARTDALKEIYDRAKRVIWLNPESRSLWNTGDSEMRHYSLYCYQVDEYGALAQLERTVSRLHASRLGVRHQLRLQCS